MSTSLSTSPSTVATSPRVVDGPLPTGLRDGQRWPLWGVAAGVLGAVGHLISAAPTSVFEAQKAGIGLEVLDLLDRGFLHVGAVAGFAAIACLLAFAAGWRHWSQERHAASPATTTIELALVASAGAMILGYGMMGALSVYLPNGINAAQMPPEALFVMWTFLDLGPFMAWWGVSVAAMAVCLVSLRSHRLPSWLGYLAFLGWLPPVAFVVATGLTGFAGVAGPVWLVIMSLGLALARPRTA